MTNKPQDSVQPFEAVSVQRKQAEGQTETMGSIFSPAQAPAQPQLILNELRVRQVELERQNEELRTARAQIDAERARYFGLYDEAPVGYCTLSEQGVILGANRTAATLLGMTRDAMVRQPLSRFIHHDDQDIYDLHHKQLLKTGTLQKYDLRLVKPDGGYIWAHLKETVDQGEDGAPVCRVVISDIGERKRAEEENRKFRTIADKAVYGKAIADLQGHLLYVNRFYAETHGYSPEELVGRNVSIFHNREQMPAADRLIAMIMRDGHFPPTKVWHRHQDGTEFPLLMSGILIKDEYGNSKCIATSAIDLSAQHQAEARLAESESLLNAVGQMVNAGGWKLDVDMQRVWWTRQTYHIHGLSLDYQPTVEEALNFYHPEDRSRLAGSLQQARSTGEPFDEEYRITNALGKPLWVRIICQPQMDAGGAYKLKGTIQDITERKLSNERIRHLNSVLKSLVMVSEIISTSQDQGRLLKDICHALTATRGYHNAWIILVDEDHRVTDSAQAGVGDAFQDLLSRFRQGEMSSCACKALDSPLLQVVPDPQTACTDCNLAGQYSGRAGFAVRLEAAGQPIGLLAVSVPRELAQDREEHELFMNLAGTIAMGVQRIRLEQIRREQERRLQCYERIISRINDPMSLVDENYRYIVVNDAYLQTFNKSRHEIEGHTVESLVGKDVFFNRVKPRLDQALAGREVVYEDSFPGLDGSPR
ncbi:PAS domain S-box protein [Desulfobulbus alkaliphilus]|uniref:PAS domain S-box protein n=1 Tax=Desulfobulbus alkaliphilus TaxID=869814 RepID=UPI001965BA15|nr:PAS domain S-box protein [Desulfobulbus alkaliphilus]MBM9536067.1 PAS domain S-box protein [Desulfobulbus alkaliphilus]